MCVRVQSTGKQASDVCARGAFQSHRLLHFTAAGLLVELLRLDMDSNWWGYVPHFNHASSPSTPVHPTSVLSKRASSAAWCSWLPRGNCPSTQLGSEGTDHLTRSYPSKNIRLQTWWQNLMKWDIVVPWEHKIIPHCGLSAQVADHSTIVGCFWQNCASTYLRCLLVQRL